MTPVRKRTRLSPEARRNQILDEAARTVQEEGLSGVAMERLATQVGISKGLVYNYFPSREALLAALLQREQADLKIRGMVSALQAESFEDLIRQTTRLYLEQTRDRGALIAALLADPAVASRLHEESLADRERTIRYFVRGVRLEYGLPLAQAVHAVEMLMAVTDQAGKLVARGELAVGEGTEMCVALILGGLSRLSGVRG